VQYSVYGYRPSLPVNAAFLAVYIIAAIIHAWLGARSRQWWFMSCMIAGAINAVIGYTGRILMYDNPFKYTAFMMQISKFLRRQFALLLCSWDTGRCWYDVVAVARDA
jgi:biotin transporter BioY